MEDSASARASLTLAAAKAALQKWQGHMRRGQQLRAESEYALALALVPLLPQPAAYSARTLRALADLYQVEGRLDEAAAFFGRVAQGGGRLSGKFWSDYTALLFKLGLRRLNAGQVALANDALAQAGQLLEKLDAGEDGDAARLAAIQGYGETALWFERAAETLPASLYAERFIHLAVGLQAWAEVGAWLKRLAQAGGHRAGPQRAMHWLQRLQDLRNQGFTEALPQAAQAAGQLAQAELALGRAEGAQFIYTQTEQWLLEAAGDSLALADLYLTWGLTLGGPLGHAKLEQALSLRRRLLGPSHPRTREAEQALGGAPVEAASGNGEPQAWDGGGRFQSEGPSWAEEVKKLHRQLARLCHPDGAASPDEAEQRHQRMVQINALAGAGDVLTLRRLLDEVTAENRS
jgi:hypothetical protein